MTWDDARKLQAGDVITFAKILRPSEKSKKHYPRLTVGRKYTVIDAISHKGSMQIYQRIFLTNDSGKRGEYSYRAFDWTPPPGRNSRMVVFDYVKTSDGYRYLPRPLPVVLRELGLVMVPVELLKKLELPPVEYRPGHRKLTI